MKNYVIRDQYTTLKPILQCSSTPMQHMSNIMWQVRQQHMTTLRTLNTLVLIETLADMYKVIEPLHNPNPNSVESTTKSYGDAI